MLYRPLLALGAILALSLTVFHPFDAQAAEFTDLLDAADDFDDNDESTYKAFDFHIEPSFRFEYSTATITREAPCVPHDHRSLDEPLVAGNQRLVRARGRCNEPTIVYNKEALYERSDSIVDLTLRAGLYKDLEFRLTVPYVLSSVRGMKYADDVDEANSSIDPSAARVRNDAQSVFDPADGPQTTFNKLDHFNTYRYAELSNEFKNYERSGFADPSIGIHWAPFNDHRDDTKATLLFGMDYVMPIAEIMEADNDAVGGGVHELQWKIAASKRYGEWIEPYFGLQYFLPIPASNSPLGEADPGSGNIGQVFTMPPQRGLITLGTEFIPYQDPTVGSRYAIDLRFTFGYTSEGRDYTPLFDHFSAEDNPCDGKSLDQVLPQFDGAGNLTNPEDVACAWIVRQPSNAAHDPTYDLAQNLGDDQTYHFNGITTVESYGTFGGQLGFYLQPSRHFQFRAVGGLTHKQEHFLTNARTGKNSERTDDNTVAL
ncbi:MAG: hypothetical protein ACNA8W_10385, partial [Bradymonadaceae bacterium]